MRLFIVFFLLFTIVNSIAAQDNPYSKKNNKLISYLNVLKYDSVKVVSFNCNKVSLYDVMEIVEDGSSPNYSMETFLHSKWLKALNNPGVVMDDKDVQTLINAFKLTHLERYDDPIGAYVPTKSVLFFYKGKICAYLIMDFVGGRYNIHFLKNGVETYEVEWESLGWKTYSFLEKLNKKYNPVCFE